MKFSATFEERAVRDEEQGDRPLVSSYLNPSMVDVKKPTSFALLEENPLCFWQVWGEEISTGKKRPFRFIKKPSDSQVREELGKDYVWGKAYNSNENAPVKECMAWPVYDFENKVVRIFSTDLYTILTQIRRIALNRKYKNLLNWDLSLAKTKIDGRTSYDVQVEPRDEDTQNELDDAWDEVQKKGFDINLMLTNGDPWNSEG